LGTLDDLGSGLGPAAAATLATGRLAELYLAFASVYRLFKGDPKVISEILPALRPTGFPGLTSASKKVLEKVRSTEGLPEDVGRIDAGCTGPETTAGPGPWIEGCVTKLVVCGTLLRVTQYRISLPQFLELLLGCLVTRILVRMKLHGELTVGLFEFLFGRTLGNAKDLIEIALAGSHERSAGSLVGVG
jgi:hypothetical protein